MSKVEMERRIREIRQELIRMNKLENYGFQAKKEIFEQYYQELKYLQDNLVFGDGPTISSESIDLYLHKDYGLPEKEYLITLHGQTKVIGRLRVSLENVDEFLQNIGYHIEKEYTGNHYSLKALELVKDSILKSGYPKIKISAYPDNYASIKIIQEFGGRLIRRADDENNWNVYEVNLEESKHNK